MTGAGPTVLIVDDEMDMRMLVRLVLEAAGRGIRVVGEAADGFDAIAAFSALDPPVVPDVVILDNRMPGRSGIEVAELMFEIADAQQIILFSAHLTPEIVNQARDIGVHRCLSKELVDQLPDMILEMAGG